MDVEKWMKKANKFDREIVGFEEVKKSLQERLSETQVQVSLFETKFNDSEKERLTFKQQNSQLELDNEVLEKETLDIRLSVDQLNRSRIHAENIYEHEKEY